jgi:hypothetical protein
MGNKNKRKHRMNGEKAKENMARGKQGGGHGVSYVNLPDGIDWFQPEYKKGKKKATYYLNLVPFIAGKYNAEADKDDLWFRSKFRIGKVGADETKIVSPSTFGEDCPMAALFFAMKDNPSISEDALKKLGTKKRELYYVQDVREKDDDGNPVQVTRLLDFSTFLFGDYLDKEMESEEYEEEGYDTNMLADPEEGRTLKVVFEQKSYGKALFSAVYKLSLEPRKGKKITDEMIDELDDPIALLDRKSIKEVKKLMADNEAGDDEDDADNLDEMTRGELKAYIKENELEIKVKKSMDDDDIRSAIQEAIGDDEDPDEDDEDPDEDDDDEDNIPMDDDDDEEGDDLEDMSRKELKEYIKENHLEVKVKKSMDDDDIRSAINDAMTDDDEEEEEEEEDDDEDFFED